MAQESNILITPFRAAFPEAGHAGDFSVAPSTHTTHSESLWIWLDTDKITVRRGTTQRMEIRYNAETGFHAVYPSASGTPLEARGEDLRKLADELEKLPQNTFRQATLHLIRQIGGDPAYAAAYVLKGDDDD